SQTASSGNDASNVTQSRILHRRASQSHDPTYELRPLNDPQLYLIRHERLLPFRGEADFHFPQTPKAADIRNLADAVAFVLHDLAFLVVAVGAVGNRRLEGLHRLRDQVAVLRVDGLCAPVVVGDACVGVDAGLL